MEIKNIKLFPNNNEQSKIIEQEVIQKIKDNNFNLVEENYDLAIAIGGDGSFLRMVRDNGFNSDIYYVGVNAGTLGFLQDVTIEQLDEFFKAVKEEKVKIDSLGIQETNIYTKGEIIELKSLNELVIRDKDLKVARLSINIDDEELEFFVGDGILVSTSIGSTAYNMSFGGSIVYNTLHTLQITPIAPLNSKSYRDLINSVIIPENKKIEIIPENENLLLSLDGENYIIDNVEKIETVVDKKRIKCLRPKGYSFSNKIKSKFLK